MPAVQVHPPQHKQLCDQLRRRALRYCQAQGAGRAPAGAAARPPQQAPQPPGGTLQSGAGSQATPMAHGPRGRTAGPAGQHAASGAQPQEQRQQQLRSAGVPPSPGVTCFSQAGGGPPRGPGGGASPPGEQQGQEAASGGPWRQHPLVAMTRASGPHITQHVQDGTERTTQDYQ